MWESDFCYCADSKDCERANECFRAMHNAPKDIPITASFLKNVNGACLLSDGESKLPKECGKCGCKELVTSDGIDDTTIVSCKECKTIVNIYIEDGGDDK